MKQIFKPVTLSLIAFSLWISWVCASLLQFDPRGNLQTHSYSVWGDWSAHFTFVNALKERGFHWLAGDNPLYPGIPFQYPFLSHVITYLFSLITFTDAIHATYYLSLILMFALPFLLFTVFKRVGLSAWGALASVLAYLLIGGFQWMDSSLKPSDPLTNQFDHASVFTQFILFEFFPQRAFLFGLLVFLACALWAYSKKRMTLGQQIGLGTVVALTSLMHVHTWIAISTFLLFLFIFPVSELKRSRKPIFLFGLGVAALSALSLAFLLLRDHGADARSSWNIWAPGWAQSADANIPAARQMNPIYFWIFNTGIFLPLAFYGMWLKRKNTSFYPIAASGIFIFAVAEFFKIQPYFYDNLKLFTYAFLFLAPFVGFALEGIAQFKKLPKYVGLGIAISLLGVQVAAGAIDIKSFQDGLQNTQFFSIEEFALADEFKTLRKSPEDIVLINPRHNHWVPCLTGNPVAMGYPGWLWSWGINYGERERQIQSILLGTSDALNRIEQLHIHYAAFVSGDQIANHPIDQAFFDSHFKKIMSSHGWSVYSLNEKLTSPSTSVR